MTGGKIAAVSIALLVAASNVGGMPTAGAESSYVSGGFAADGGGGLGTVGYGWVNDDGVVVGHITVDHLVRGADVVDFAPTDHFGTPANSTMSVLGRTDDVDVGLIAPAANTIAPIIELSDGTRLTVTDYAAPGEITAGQKVCHSGHNEVTETMHEVCTTVTQVRATSHCTAKDGSSSCVVSAVSNRADGWPGGPGDSGAAAYTYNEDGTITVVGTWKSGNGNGGDFEPTYAAMDVFSGHPLTTQD